MAGVLQGLIVTGSAKRGLIAFLNFQLHQLQLTVCSASCHSGPESSLQTSPDSIRIVIQRNFKKCVHYTFLQPQLPALYLLPSLRYDHSKKTSPMVTYTKFMKAPTLTPPVLVCDVNADNVQCSLPQKHYCAQIDGFLKLDHIQLWRYQFYCIGFKYSNKTNTF